jgi:hypothetical protein
MCAEIADKVASGAVVAVHSTTVTAISVMHDEFGGR